ncbi:glycosyltransferase family 2 protein [Paenibacillus azoreducens]|uniref:glycosyltransferase family 2 protein n=1 Tax=Paenibacillus azoreducens TaxID=116718 RepID=UPI0039F579F2
MRRTKMRKPANQDYHHMESNLITDAGVRYRLGYERGYEQGVARGRETFGQPFHGTSIVIPSYNQVDYLARCIESIETHTTEPYEIIVVDNGSTDGTASYLEKRAGQLRFALLEANKGFAGGVNQGLMMAKGDTIVILNNDTLVTPGWLTHMMQCLLSDPMIGVVGPVTNYISGEQQIDVPYDTVDEMWEYAAVRGKPDKSKWKVTDRLVGFCLLFRRELLKNIGYFDEGFRIGNYEDEDWMIRLRLRGLKLVIAGDSFIHHFGSVSMKKLGQEQFEEIHSQNEQYYTKKWGDPHSWVNEVRQSGLLFRNGTHIGRAGTSADFFPSHVLIRDQGEQRFLLYHGCKYPYSGLEEQEGIEPVLLSRLDIRSIPTAANEMTWEEMMRLSGNSNGQPADGQLFRSGDGTVYQWGKDMIRPFVSDFALERWNLKERIITNLPEELLQSVPRGLPVIAPPILQNPVL